MIVVFHAGAAGNCPVTVYACGVACFTCLLGCGCVKTVLMLHKTLCKALVCVDIAGQRYILLCCENILYLRNVYGVCACSVGYCHRSGNACCLTCTDALRNEVDIVDCNAV